MQRLTFAALLISLLLMPLAAMAQERKMHEGKQMQMMEMMKDSTMMSMMMERIAKDDHMRMMMMQKMMKSAKGDQARMMQMCKAMVEDKDMHAMMMKMMAGEKQATENAAQEVLVKFKPDTKEVQIKAMAEEIGMQQVKEIKELNVRVFKVTGQKSLKEVIEHCQKEPFVEYAEPNQTYKMQKK
ncbi:MAG: hypothetical protein ACE5HO_10475 [bacterium]